MTLRLRPHLALSVALVVLGALLVGCGSGGDGASASAGASGAPDITVSQATFDAPANPTVSVIRMVIRNDGGTPDRLVAVSTPVAQAASIHRSGTDEEGRATMASVAAVTIPARSTVTFEPDGLHVMVTGIDAVPKVGTQVPIDLTFARSGKVEVQAEVVPAGSTQEGHDGH